MTFTHFLALTAALTLAGFLWWRDMGRRPYRKCLRCNGTGRNSRGRYWGDCRCCKGKGRHLRLDVIIFRRSLR